MATIGSRRIGPGERCFVVAEAGVNHDGDVETALALIDAAADAGADAVKFQTFAADRLAAAHAPKARYQIEREQGADESQLEMLKRLELPRDAYVPLLGRCSERGIAFLSAAFDPDAAEFLTALGAPALKVPSGELTNPFLLEAVASSGLPVILSTGMADLDEVRAAVELLVRGGAGDIVVLHCVTAYPATPSESNLRAMATLEQALGRPVGLSDHTLGTSVPLAAVALGARMLEKHLTLDRSRSGPDHAASLEPNEFAALVAAVREVESALGDGVKRPMPSELENVPVVRRSLAAARDLVEGTTLERSMLTALRPGTGISPLDRDEIVGRRLKRALGRNELIEVDDLE
jgi:N,N'-diacetyllegionaminate synthase